MARRQDPVQKSIADVLADLREGLRESTIIGPEAALKFLDRTLASHHSLPNAVKCFAYDAIAEVTAQLGLWERCVESSDLARKHLPDAERDLSAELKVALPSMAMFERGIAAKSEQGDFEAALALCDEAVNRGLGAHFSAKRDSLEWAR
jgi:hypothetical protein